jgi:hypothetical protein
VKNLPRARRSRLIVRRLPDETLVYDLERCRAHCLAPVASAVWRHCDGRTSPAEVAARASAETGTIVDEAAVWIAAGRLAEANLLEGKLSRPGGRSRREWLGRTAAVAAGLAVFSVTAPLAVEAATCVPNCSSRPDNPPGNCGAIPCCPPATGNCCAQGNGQNCDCRTMGGCTP